MSKTLQFIYLLVAVLFVPSVLFGQTFGWRFEVESGIVVNGYNDVRIPGDTGSDISLTDDLEPEETPFIRFFVARDLGRHHLGLLVAPLRIEAEGSMDRAIDFNGETFEADTPLRSRYRFDSYRLSYWYDFVSEDDFVLGLGFTAKIRDAAIALSNDNQSTEKTNTGFVPLLHLDLQWWFSENMSLVLKGDGLAAPQGRAEDFLLAIDGAVSSRMNLLAGYRILEGGADNDEVYSFALVHYATAGVSWRF